MRFANAHKWLFTGEEMLPKSARLLHIEFHPALQFKRVARPNDRVAGRVMQCEKSSNVGRPGKVQQARRSAVILHQRQPLEIIVTIRDVREEVDGFPLEDPQNAFLLVAPCVWIDSIR